MMNYWEKRFKELDDDNHIYGRTQKKHVKRPQSSMSRKGKPSSVAKQIQRQNEQLLRSASKSTLKSRVSDANRSVLDHVPNHFETDNSGSLNHQSSRDRITEPSMHTNFTRLNTEGQALDDTCASSINSRNKAAWLRKMLHSRADYEKAKARLGIDVGDDFVPNYCIFKSK